MSDEVETMAWASSQGRPWHGLGNEVRDDMSVDEMLIASGLNWHVEKRKIQWMLGKERGPVSGHFALTRREDDHVLTIIGSNYKEVQNEESFDFFKKYVNAGHMKMATAGSLKEGQYTWALAQIEKEFAINKKDRIQSYLLMMSPHLFGMSMIFQWTPICVVCWNTLNMALGSSLKGKPGSYRVPHSRYFNDETKKNAEIALGLANEQMDEFAEAAKVLSTKRIKDEELKGYFWEVSSLPQPKEEDEEKKEPKLIRLFNEAFVSSPGQELPSREGTWWGAVNSVTYVVDHELGRTRDNGLTNAWFGQAALMKRKALHVALKIAA